MGRQRMIVWWSEEDQVWLVGVPASQLRPNGRRYTASEVMRMPAAERSRILAESAAAAEVYYRNDPELTAFEAFGKDDLYDEYPE